jgi:hypothetical protein
VFRYMRRFKSTGLIIIFNGLVFILTILGYGPHSNIIGIEMKRGSE